MRLHAGDVLVIGPDDPHICLRWCGERFVAIFRRSMLRQTGLDVRCRRSSGLEVAGVRIPTQTHVVPWRRTALEYSLDRLHQESFGGQHAKLSMCAALLAQVLLELARNEGDRRTMPPAAPNPLYSRPSGGAVAGGMKKQILINKVRKSASEPSVSSSRPLTKQASNQAKRNNASGSEPPRIPQRPFAVLSSIQPKAPSFGGAKSLMTR